MIAALTLLTVLMQQAAQPQATEQSGAALEFQIKAAYILNFIRFTSWPAEALGPAGSPFRVCAAGADPLGGALEATMKGESVEGHPVVVERLPASADALQCQVLYVARGTNTPEMLQSIARAPVLTVGESEHFLEDGGIVIFAMEQGRVRFDVNRQNAERRKLTLSSRLLRVARSVR